MRLLHCKVKEPNYQNPPVTLVQKEYGDKTPPYAILSHRWGETNEEVSFNDLESDLAMKKRKGYKKLMGFVRKPSRMDMIMFGSIPAALTRAVAPNFRRQ
jgi:hypothetical protein